MPNSLNLSRSDAETISGLLEFDAIPEFSDSIRMPHAGDVEEIFILRMTRVVPQPSLFCLCGGTEDGSDGLYHFTRLLANFFLLRNQVALIHCAAVYLGVETQGIRCAGGADG